MNKDMCEAWMVWIDENKKVITFKENPEGKEVVFKSRDVGIKIVAILATKGYRIG